MIATDVISSGLTAWQRLCKRDRASWSDWLDVGRALAVGRTHALNIAGTNKPVGTKYNLAMGRWLNENGLDGVCAQERYRIGLVLDNLPAISAWRESLDEAKQRSFNHPAACWHAWKRFCNDHEKATAQRQHIVQSVTKTVETARRGKPVFWSQLALRRAHQAMLDSRSSDLLILARVALQAAIRNEGDLIELLNDAPPHQAKAQVAAYPA